MTSHEKQVIDADNGYAPIVSIETGDGVTVGAANPLPVNASAMGRGGGIYATANFTPTAVSYTAGNIIDTAKEFAFTFSDGSAIPAGSLVRLLSAVVKIDATALISGEAAYSAYGYNVTPPSAQANNAAWTLTSGDLPSYRGPLTLGTPVDLGGALHVKTQLFDQQDIKLTTSSLWLELVNGGTFTGAAVARQISLYGIVL